MIDAGATSVVLQPTLDESDVESFVEFAAAEVRPLVSAPALRAARRGAMSGYAPASRVAGAAMSGYAAVLRATTAR